MNASREHLWVSRNICTQSTRFRSPEHAPTTWWVCLVTAVWVKWRVLRHCLSLQCLFNKSIDLIKDLTVSILGAMKYHFTSIGIHNLFITILSQEPRYQSLYFLFASSSLKIYDYPAWWYGATVSGTCLVCYDVATTRSRTLLFTRKMAEWIKRRNT